MHTLINGKFEEQVSAKDRGLLYGQSVFETIAVVNGKPALLPQHLDRLSKGCGRLAISLNINSLKNDIEVISPLFEKQKALVLRITITQGVGGRGYQNPEVPESTRILTLHDYPSQGAKNGIEQNKAQALCVGLSPVVLSHQPLLAGIKHGNRLEQVLARSSWQDGWHEALLLDSMGNVIEGTQSNLIVIDNKSVRTPLLDQCGVDGVMKNWAISALKETGFSCSAVRLSIEDIKQAEEVLISNSVLGIRAITELRLPNNTIHYESTANAQKLTEILQRNEIIPSH